MNVIHRTKGGRYFVVDPETGEILSEHETLSEAEQYAQTPDTG